MDEFEPRKRVAIHAICVECYNMKFPDRAPMERKWSDQEVCCFCTMITKAGIYILDSASIACKHYREGVCEETFQEL